MTPAGAVCALGQPFVTDSETGTASPLATSLVATGERWAAAEEVYLVIRQPCERWPRGFLKFRPSRKLVDHPQSAGASANAKRFLQSE